MSLLRLLTNGLIVGLLGAAYLTILFLQLNRALPLAPGTLVPLFLAVWLFYGTQLTALFCGVILVEQLFAGRTSAPAWFSVRLLAWAGALTAAAAATLMWFNVWGFAAALDPEAARNMGVGAFVVALAALALLAVGVLRSGYRWQGSWVNAAVLVAVMTASIVLPLRFRGAAVVGPLGSQPLVSGEPDAGAPASRVTMILLDGASLEYIAPAVASGRLPNLGTVLDRGAAMHLVTVRPTQPATVWAAVATGKYPAKNGVQSAAGYEYARNRPPIELLPDLCFARALVRVGLLREVPNTAGKMQARPFWSILSAHAISVGIVNLPLTYPVQPVRGYLVSDRFHLMAGAPGTVQPDLTVYPAEAVPNARTAAFDVPATDRPEVLAAVDVEDAPSDDPLRPDIPTTRDRATLRVAGALAPGFATVLTAVRFEGLDTVGHRFLRYANPESFGDVSDAERRLYGDVLDAYYRFIDARIGGALASQQPGDLLLVVSGFGMEPLSPGKRMLAWLLRDPDLSGSHEGAPDGFLLAYGSDVAPGHRASLGSIVDVVPTLLYFLGLPIGRDMDGFARTDLFTRTFTAERPVSFIPTHDR